MEYHIKIRIEYWEKLSELFEYYHSINEDLGIRFYQAVDKALQKVIEAPEIFQIQTKNYRQILVKEFPYLIIFEIMETEIVIYTIFPAKSNPKNKPD